MVLDTEDIDVLDRVRSEYRWGDASPSDGVQLLDEAIEANDKLLDRLDDTLARIGAFRDERAAKSIRLREARRRARRHRRPRRRPTAIGRPVTRLAARHDAHTGRAPTHRRDRSSDHR